MKKESLPYNDSTCRTLQESLEVYSSSWKVPTIDLEFAAGKIKLAKGVTLTLTRLRLTRADAGVPIGSYCKGNI